MEKNVGSIDLEELKRAREELMQERGLTEEAPASSYESVQPESSPESADTGYGAEEQSSSIDNPNVSRVFERQESAPQPKQEEKDDFDFDIDALVNEVYSGNYDGEIDEVLDLSNDNEISVDDFIGNEEPAETMQPEIAKQPSVQEPVKESMVSQSPESTKSTPVEQSVSQPANEERDFSVYDSFAAFEVNDDAMPEQPAETPASTVQQKTQEESVVQEDDNDVNSMIDDFYKAKDAESDDLSTLANDLQFDDNSHIGKSSNLEEPVHSAGTESTPEPAVESVSNAKVEDDGFSALDSFEKFEVSAPAEEEKTETDSNAELQDESGEPSLASLGLFNFDKKEEPEAQENSVEQTVDSNDDFDGAIVENAMTEDVNETESTQAKETAETEEDATQAEPVEEETMSMVSSLSDLEKMLKEDDERASKLDEEIEKLEEQVKSGEMLDDETDETSAKTPETTSTYKTIEPYKFVDVIDLDEFKESDKLTYILGKDEQGVMHYGNLRDNYNLVVFGKENEHVNNFVHSVLLSLILKNTVNEVNFVICDSKADSKFEVYNNSSYMYFNRIAKTNKEILDILIELNKELEERYKLLADIGVKSIEQYNIIAKNDNLKPLPYIVTVFNNYSKAIQLTESDKINTCLYQMLKFGRIAGLYIVLAANNTIMSNEINYNLPTRVSFKCEDSSMSLTTLGEDGAESLSKDGDFLCSTIGAEGLVHLKVASLTSNEIELLIENIED